MRLPTEFAYYLNREMRETLHRRAHHAWRECSVSLANCDMPAVLFRSEQGGPATVEDEAMGWRSLCPNIRILHVSGGHESMLRPPHLPALREQFLYEVAKATTVCHD
jgi:thioesterase domain-containing protein